MGLRKEGVLVCEGLPGEGVQVEAEDAGDGGGGVDLAAEHALSNFDQRHVATASLQYTTGMGLRGGAIRTGRIAAMLAELDELHAGRKRINSLGEVVEATPESEFISTVRFNSFIEQAPEDPLNVLRVPSTAKAWMSACRQTSRPCTAP